MKNSERILEKAFKEHKQVDVFHQPGKCDLTVNVDFAYLKEAMPDTGIHFHDFDAHVRL